MKRRTFLGTLGLGIKGIIGCVLALPGLGFLLDPLRRSGRSRGFIPIATLDTAAFDRPTRVVISADRWDAYTHYPPGPIGQVWLVREGREEVEPKVRCYQAVCPHLGCIIDYASTRAKFYCPCHASEFDISGRRGIGPSPRDMDELQCRVTEPDKQGRRWIEVRYQEFQTGGPARRATT